jgi:hypothetical protein
MKPKIKKKSGLELALSIIELRRKSAASILADAINNKAWSQVSGYDGIEIGLIIAKKIIEEEIEHEAKD